MSHGVDELLRRHAVTRLEGQSRRDRPLFGASEHRGAARAVELDAPEQPYPGHLPKLDLVSRVAFRSCGFEPRSGNGGQNVPSWSTRLKYFRAYASSCPLFG